ncbi:MAG: metallopeptidase TldD-related protein [Ignisphaera sp.]
MSIYIDKIRYQETVAQIAYRDNSIEINNLTANVLGARINKGGCWYIVSKQGINTDPSDLEKKVLSLVRDSVCGDFSEAELFKGTVEIGKEFPSEDEVAQFIIDLCQEVKASYNVKCEIVVGMHYRVRTISREGEDDAKESKKFVDVEIGLLGATTYGQSIFASSHSAFVAWSANSIVKNIDSLFRDTVSRIGKSIKVKALKPYEVGKSQIILGNEATAALIHEISHMLSPLYPHSARLVGSKLFPEEFNMYDEPNTHDTPAIRFFDDEGVATRKRVLIENGVIRDLHHTRATARAFSSEPGSAHGLFTSPIPFHTTLVLASGDWGEREMVEETKRGFLIDGISIAMLEEGYIRIVPQTSFLIENGEIVESMKIREVRVPFQALKTINAISKNHKTRVSEEKDWIVSEIAPQIRLEGFVY